MYKKIFSVCFLICFGTLLSAQEVDNSALPVDSIGINPADVPVITYTNSSRKYEIADIKVTGASNYEDFVLIGFSGLAVGDKIKVPGKEITDAVKRFWKHGLFSDVKIIATRMTDDKVWLEIALKQRPIISDITITGVKKGEKKDIEERIGMAKGSQITPNLIDKAKKIIKKYFEEKGFSNAAVQISQKDDFSNPGKVFLDIEVDKKEKTKIHAIYINGNENLNDLTLKKSMKKTNEGFDLMKRFKLSWLEMFSTKKYIREEYEKDLDVLLEKYTEMGYRDAEITSDSVVEYSDKKVDIYINIEEGKKYYLRSLKWLGNTVYPSEKLDYALNMKPGDIYNQKKLNERISTDEDAVSNLYLDNGYIFFRADPIETNVENDSIDLEIRMVEGSQATINKVIINGNDRVYEDVVRRELRTKPGQLFSKEDLMRSLRELAQMGHFDPETSAPDVRPDPETATVDIAYNLVPKSNDQVEFSMGWGQTGLIGRIALKFTNFSMYNLFNPSTYKGIIPQGDGQSLTLSGQTNGRYYQSYSISFMDPWFGGKRPNSLSLSAYYMKQTRMASNAYSGYSYYDNPYYTVYDEDKYMQIFGVSLGYGKRLTWPDDFFSISGELSYQRYKIRGWQYFFLENGDCNNFNVGLTLSRNSIDNPFYTRSGSQFSLSVNFTPPYSLWDGKDYASLPDDSEEKNKWIEYHKWKFKAKIFMPLTSTQVKRTPVLMSRIEYGFVGYYNSFKKSPFETFYMGGSGMSGYSGAYATETVALRGYDDGSLTPNRGDEGYAYSRFALELRYPFMFEPTSTIYGLLWAEAGNAWHDIKSFSPFDVKRAAGVGVRIFLPMIGMMGIDWGYGFDRPTPRHEVSGSWFGFILGQEF